MRLNVEFALDYLAEHRRQLAVFLVVGGITFGVYFLLFHLLFGELHLDYRVAISIAYFFAVLSHFVLHRSFTFNALGQRIVHNVPRYLVTLTLNYGTTLFVAWLIVEALGLSPYIGAIASTAATASTSFFLLKYFVFRSEEGS